MRATGQGLYRTSARVCIVCIGLSDYSTQRMVGATCTLSLQLPRTLCRLTSPAARGRVAHASAVILRLRWSGGAYSMVTCALSTSHTCGVNQMGERRRVSERHRMAATPGRACGML